MDPQKISLPIDFGVAADDYARYRPGFPDAFFDRVRRAGAGLPGQRVLDLGTGTGSLARGFAAGGCQVVGLDPSAEMLGEAVSLTRADGLAVHYVQGVAEAPGLEGEAFDLVCAGQCWHWFDRVRVSREIARLLRIGGRVLIAYLTYLSDPGTLGAATESLILRHHPEWRFSGSDGRYPQYAVDLVTQGFHDLEAFEFDLDILFTHDAWRGRFRSCNGVFPLAPEKRVVFDSDLQALLAASYPNPLRVPYRTFGILARK